MLTATQQLSVQGYIDHVSNIYGFLMKETDLSPRNPQLNATLHRFVQDTTEERSPEEVAAILNTAVIQQIAPSVRHLLGRAEREMEHFCAAAMIDGESEADQRFSSYSNFIYRDNYEALVAAELQAMKWQPQIQQIRTGGESIAFIGAGPLPISAIMLHQRTGLQVTCIDSDRQACQLGRQLILCLAEKERGHRDIDKAVHFVYASGEEHDYRMHPIVFVANLVESKEQIINRIVKTCHAVTTTIIRSAEGLSTLLYTPENGIGTQEKYIAYLLGKTRRSPKVISTSLVYRFPPESMAESGFSAPAPG